MKRTSEILGIALFIVIIGLGTILNLPKLFVIADETTKEYRYEAWTTIIGLEYSERFFDKYAFVNANGFFHKLLGQRSMNSVVKLDSGKLVVCLEQQPVWQQAQKTGEFYEALTEEGIEFLYVQVPYEIDKYDCGLPEGVEDYSNADADLFLQQIGERGVPYVDLRECMKEAGMLNAEAFFKTDHHWTIETAFWAYTETVSLIEKRLSVEIPKDYTELTSYQVEMLENSVLGSNGRKTGIAYAGLDDISLIYPKFETQVIFEAPEDGIYKEGSFQEAFMAYERLEGDNLYEMLQYNVYIGEDYAVTVQRCVNAPADKKILLIKDSYYRPVQAFLGTTFSRVDTLDLRYYTKDVMEYIRQLQPDMVLLCYNPYMVQDVQHFRFQE